MEKPIKVGIIGIKGLPAQAGVDRVVESLVKRLPGLGVFPTVYCDDQYSDTGYHIDGVRIVRVKSLHGKYLSAPSRFLNCALNAVVQEDFDLIHLHNIEAGFVLPILRLKYPVISTAHGFAYWRSKWGPFAREIIKLVDWPFVRLSSMVTSVSAKDAELMSKKYRTKIRYIPNGVGSEYKADTEKAKPVLANLGLQPKEFFIFVAGRIEPTKGAHLAIEAVNRLEENIPLLIVGNMNHISSYADHLHQIAGPQIHFLSSIEDKELLFGLMESSRCLIFPSFVEAMSMVLLEAASVGVPILASDIPENREVLGNDIEYFKSQDVDSLVDRLRWVLKNNDVILEQSKKAKNEIFANYSWDNLVPKYVNAYEKILIKENTDL